MKDTSSSLASGWNTLWSALTGAWPNLTTLLNLVAVIVLVSAIVVWFWKRKSGLSGGDNKGLVGALVFAAVCALPGVFIPVLLGIADLFINFAVKVSTNIK